MVRSARSKVRWSGRVRYAASWVSEVRPARSQPRAQIASSGPLASCIALCRSGSAEPVDQRGLVGTVQLGRRRRTPRRRRRPGPARSRLRGPNPSGRSRPRRCARRWRARPASRPTPRAAGSRPRDRTRPPARPRPRWASASSSRSRSTRNSSPSNNWWVASRFHGRRSRSSMVSGSSRSSTSALICRLRSTSSIRSWNASAALPFSSPACAVRFSRPSYISSHLAAVFGPTPGTPGQVVAGLADQGRQVGIALRGREVLLLHRLGGHPGQVGNALARVEHGDAVGNQLERVAVAGADQHVETLGLGLGGQGADHVVRLEARLFHVGDVEGLQHLLDQVELTLELVRGLGPVGLVLGVDLGAEGLPGHVEGHAQVGRRLVAQHVDQHRGEAEHAVGVLAGLGGEVFHRESEEGSISDGVPVDQHQLGSGLGRHTPTLSIGSDSVGSPSVGPWTWPRRTPN